MIESARTFATADTGAIQWGLAIDQTKYSFPTAHALIAIMSITGNIDIPGGMTIYRNPYDIDQVTMRDYDLLTEEQAAKRIGLEKYPLLQFGIPLAHPDEMVNQMDSDLPYPIKGMWIQTTNPIACMASEPRRVYDQMMRLDFIAAADPFMTPTIAALADVVLPVTFYPEADSLYSEQDYALGAIIKAVEPKGECKSDYEICLELGKRLAPEDWPWETADGSAYLADTAHYRPHVPGALQARRPALHGFPVRKAQEGLAASRWAPWLHDAFWQDRAALLDVRCVGL